MRRLLKNQGGFTLIELLIVVLIIGVLAGIAVPQVAGRSDEAKATACKANMKQIETALESYYLDNQKYPSTGHLDDLTDRYLKGIPRCPAGKKNYEYEYEYESKDDKTFTLTCPYHKDFEVTEGSEKWDPDSSGDENNG